MSRVAWLREIAREDVSTFTSTRIRKIPFTSDYNETLKRYPGVHISSCSHANITELLQGCKLNIKAPGIVSVEDINLGIDFVRERTATTVNDCGRLLSNFVDRYTTDPRQQSHWDGVVIRLFELQSYLELCALTRAFLVNARKLTDGYRESRTFDTEYAIGDAPNFHAWALVLEGLFCFPTGKRTNKSWLHVLRHHQRAYSRRISLLQTGFQYLLDAHVTQRFRTEWLGSRELDTDSHARLLHANPLFRAAFQASRN
jgi:hypothetical protein